LAFILPTPPQRCDLNQSKPRVERSPSRSQDLDRWEMHFDLMNDRVFQINRSLKEEEKTSTSETLLSSARTHDSNVSPLTARENLPHRDRSGRFVPSKHQMCSFLSRTSPFACARGCATFSSAEGGAETLFRPDLIENGQAHGWKTRVCSPSPLACFAKFGEWRRSYQQ
jgi:hypothetical protein